MAQMDGGYWSDTRPNGKPLEPGTLRWVTRVPLDGGYNEISTYGRTKDEVIDKLSLTVSTAQAKIARQAKLPGEQADGRPNVEPPLIVRQRMTPDQVMQNVADLDNPAKSGEAITRLVEDATGVDLRMLAVREFRVRAEEWEKEHPDFFHHPGNIQLLTAEAKRLANYDLASISKEVLTKAFENLQSRGMLFSAPDSAEPSNQPPNPTHVTPFPGGSPVQRTETPRGARFATGTRSNRFGSGIPNVAHQPKFTSEDVRKMPLSRQKELNNPRHPDHKEWSEACERLYSSSAV